MDYVPAVEEPLGSFSRTQRRQCLMVTIIDDEICEEPEESFRLNISAPEFVNVTREVVKIYISDSGEIECSKSIKQKFHNICVFVLKCTSHSGMGPFFQL